MPAPTMCHLPPTANENRYALTVADVPLSLPPPRTPIQAAPDSATVVKWEYELEEQPPCVPTEYARVRRAGQPDTCHPRPRSQYSSAKAVPPRAILGDARNPLTKVRTRKKVRA